MTSRTVEAEVTAIEETTIDFCDDCGEPISELDERNLVSLYRNPQITVSNRKQQDRVKRIALQLAKKDPYRVKTEEVRSIGSSRADTVTKMSGLRPEVSKLEAAVQEAAGSLETDGNIDICKQCLQQMGGPYVEDGLEVLNLQEAETTEDAMFPLEINRRLIFWAGLIQSIIILTTVSTVPGMILLTMTAIFAVLS